MSILRKRRKKSELIRHAYEAKTKQAHSRTSGGKTVSGRGAGKVKPTGSYITEYREMRKRFRLTVFVASVSLVSLWWLPLLGPMLSGYVTGRFSGKKWLGVKAMIIPVIVIVILVNLAHFGLYAGTGITYVFSQFIAASVPSLSPFADALVLVHNALGIGANGYVILAVIMTYVGGMVSENNAACGASSAGKAKRAGILAGSRTQVGEKSSDFDDEKDIFRYRDANQKKHHSGISGVAESISGVTARTFHSGHSRSQPTSSPYIRVQPASSMGEGWVRGKYPSQEGERSAADEQSFAGPDTLATESSAPAVRYTHRQTVGVASAGQNRRENSGVVAPGRNAVSGSTAGNDSRRKIERGISEKHPDPATERKPHAPNQISKLRVTTIIPSEKSELDGVDSVRRVPTAGARREINRALVDRAVKSYKSEAQEKKQVISRGEPECQMGASYRRRGYDTL